MNREDIIRMAREAGEAEGMVEFVFHPVIERFAALVASAEREYLRESFRVVTAAEVSAAILHEREACAKICVDESWRLKKIAFEHENLQANSAAIRASILAEMIRARGDA